MVKDINNGKGHNWKVMNCFSGEIQNSCLGSRVVKSLGFLLVNDTEKMPEMMKNLDKIREKLIMNKNVIKEEGRNKNKMFINDTVFFIPKISGSNNNTNVKNMHLHRDSNPGPWNTVPML